MELINLADQIADFADSAALVMEMDLVITVDTAMAHLVGALGRPVWVLLPFVPDFRWMLEREDTALYPSMRLFRQKRRGEWDEVIQRVRDALRDLVAATARRRQ
jgi:ADP-heptose:LPS heptosyltransferase